MVIRNGLGVGVSVEQNGKRAFKDGLKHSLTVIKISPS